MGLPLVAMVLLTMGLPLVAMGVGFVFVLRLVAIGLFWDSILGLFRVSI